jgi:hypothetical protein
MLATRRQKKVSPPGSYQPLTGQTSCLLADPGNFVSAGGATAETKCAPGSYQPATGQTSCQAAEIGYYVPTAGQASETACPPLQTTSAPGATSCVTKLGILLTQVTGVGPGTSLADTVKIIQSDVSKNNKTGACGELALFISEVNAQTGKSITKTQAASFVAQAKSIEAALGC